MKHTEYIIVGEGYAAMFFALQLIKNKKSFLLFSDGKISASQVSAGVINPVVLKKFTTFWKAQEQIDSLNKTLNEISEYTCENYLINEAVHRIFHDENEKQLWLKKSENEELKPFLSKNFVPVENVENPFATGEVLQSARLNVAGFFNGMFHFLKQNQHLVNESFDYKKFDAETSVYNAEISFEKIVFAEGMGVLDNPYFKDIPVNANKGHNLKVSFKDDFNEKKTLKKKHFLFPISERQYYYGGTYDRDDFIEKINENAVIQLKNGLSEIYKDHFFIDEIRFGFRPTVKDRRPILGQHLEFKNLFVFNGLGARGVLNGSYFSKVLYDFTENHLPLPEEVDLQRFQ